MPSDPAQPYQPHVSPARRANTQSSTNTSPPLPSLSLNHGVFTFSHPSSTVTTAAVAGPSSSTTPSQVPAHHQPSTRGRQPKSLSKPARAKQRKTDHSIIEKARRAKINEALAELKGLVPANWGREGSGGDAEDKGGDDNDTEGEDEAEDGEDDAEDDPRSTTKTRKRQSTGSQPAKPSPSKGKGKEREFKLDILERTVGYIKEVIGKVTELEGEVEALRAGEKTAGAITRDDRDGCSRCSSQDSPERNRGHEGRKRGRDSFSEDAEPERNERPSKRFQPIPPPALLPGSASSSTDTRSPAVDAQSRSRLPSISSWLPSALALNASDSAQPSTPNNPPNLFTFNPLQSRSGSTSPQNPAYMHYPPSSVQFNPIHAHSTVAAPPKLNSSGPNVPAPATSQRGTPSKEPGPAAMGTSWMRKGGPG